MIKELETLPETIKEKIFMRTKLVNCRKCKLCGKKAEGYLLTSGNIKDNIYCSKECVIEDLKDPMEKLIDNITK